MEFESRKKFLINIAYFALILSIVFIIVKYGISLISPFLFAFIVAYIIKKPAKFIATKLKIPYKIVAVLLVLIFYIIIGLLLVVIGVKLFSAVLDIIYKLPSIYYTYILPSLVKGFDKIEDLIMQLDPTYLESVNDIFNQSVRSIGQSISSISMKTVTFLSVQASSIPALFVKLMITLISTFFIAVDYENITKFIFRQLKGKTKDMVLNIKDYVINTLFVVIRSYILIMSLTFVELSIGLSIMRIENAIIIAALVSMLDILPVLGTGTVMIPWALITAIQGDMVRAVSLLIIYLIITVIRNVVEPRFIGKQMGLHPVVSLMSMFVGAKLFGAIGLFGLPITISLLLHLMDNKTIKSFKIN
jgi:sporulation integral membrane protein YtvI